MCYRVMTKEGVHYKFIPTLEGLYAYTVNRNTDGNIFGKNMPNNGTDYRHRMCYIAYQAPGVDSDDDHSDKEDNGLPELLWGAEYNSDSNSDDEEDDKLPRVSSNIDSEITGVNRE